MRMRRRLSPEKRVLFVDDEAYVHDYVQNVARKLRLKPRHAFNPAEAERIIARRLVAVQKLLSSKQALLQKETLLPQKRRLRNQIRLLEQMQSQPFNLIVSDINMPRGDPTGVPLVRKLKYAFPNQKILMHSDDFENLELLAQELGIPSVYKGARREQDLETGIRKVLKPEKKPFA